MSATPGEPRLVAGETIPRLFPGEVAHAASFRMDGQQIIITSWMIEPMPGWRGHWLRWRWRWIGRWWPWGAPRIVGHLTLEKRKRK